MHKVPVAYFPLSVPSASPLSFLPPPASFSSSSSSSFSPASVAPKNITVILSLFATVYCLALTCRQLFDDLWYRLF